MSKKYLLNEADVDGMRMAAVIAGKVLDEYEGVSREDIIAYYIETLRMAYNEICEAFDKDARRSNGPYLNLP